MGTQYVDYGKEQPQVATPAPETDFTKPLILNENGQLVNQILPEENKTKTN